MNPPNPICLGNMTIGPGHPLCLIAGPCALESTDHALDLAHSLREICQKRSMPLIFKASFDKANRTSPHSQRGPGLEQGLAMLQRVKEQLHLYTATDIHHPEQAPLAAQVCDLLQIPALLCRQTDLLVAAGKTKAVINIKKGQFMAPWEMRHAVEKVIFTGNQAVLLTDRGTCFGYNNLVSDLRSLPIMRAFASGVCFDVTHSLQMPGSLGQSSGSARQFVPTLARAAVAAGCDALFVETHKDPQSAPSDAAAMWPLADLPALLDQCLALHALAPPYSHNCVQKSP